MSDEQIRLQVPLKLVRVNSWIAQMIRQWIPECLSGDRKCTGPKADLGMFSMFREQRPHKKGAPHSLIITVLSFDVIVVHRIACVSSTFQWFNSLHGT